MLLDFFYGADVKKVPLFQSLYFCEKIDIKGVLGLPNGSPSDKKMLKTEYFQCLHRFIVIV